MNKNSKTHDEFKPSRKEIRAINHYWEVAMAQAKAVKNREQRRKNHPRG